MLNLIHLQSFLVVAEEQSITRASKKLFMNPSSLQQQMNLFEAELGFKVLERSRRGCSLTAAGAVIAKQGARLLGDVDEMLDAAAEVAGNSEQTITIALAAPFNAQVLIDAFKERYSYVRFKHVPYAYSDRDEMMASLAEGKVDIVEYGYISQVEGRGVSFQEYDRDKMCLACSTSHLLSQLEEIPFEALEGLTIYACKNGSDINRVIAEYIDRHGLKVNFQKTLYSPERVMDICEQGDAFLLAEDQAGMFKHLHIMPLIPEFYYRHSFAYADDCRPVVAEFVEFVREGLR
ncbi:LysR family transcriptional regulator [Adlercreutzia sp. R25]|uniref:LysR family transcriptional regulator n=1 Tax=Adlercreutzia shanghongiae TaxID=3111773 RepID=UPI002DBA6619|nr:LysR family transcriptional regulator [Adlercreutzia sp. R25]MEC4271883.1 LysR family transcriptional regulator [Adlercreutzia sp. R25]